MIQRIQRSRHINQRNFKAAIASAGILAVLGFFIYQFKFLRPPSLELSSPTRNTVTADLAVDVRGRTDDPEADLTLNGRPLYSGESGEFTERIYLSPGPNRLDVEAKNRYGKTTKITRYIVVAQ